MEKAVLLIGGVALVAYAVSGAGDENNGNGKHTHEPGTVHVLPPPIHDESPGLLHLRAPQRRLLPNDFEHDTPGLKHLKAPQRRLLPNAPLHESGVPLKLQPPPRRVLPPPIHNESPGLEHLTAPQRRLLPFHSDPLRLEPPPRHVLPPPIHSESPGLEHLQAPRRRLLPGPIEHVDPRDPLKLIPLAPKHVLPPIVSKPIGVIKGEARCTRLESECHQKPGRGGGCEPNSGNWFTAWYNYPGPKTPQECYEYLITVPCPNNTLCAMYWDGKPMQ